MLRNRPTGMTAFTIVWFGQVVSLTASAMTQFALVYWAYQLTGQATALALMGFFAFGPTVLLSPVAGALVDRWNRKLVMMMSDIGAGLATVAILVLHLSGVLEIWHVYVAGAFAGAFGAFQFPAYSAAVTTMLPKEQYARANGMMSVAEAGSHILAPILAGVLLAKIGVAGIMAIDVATFILAVGALLVVHIPQPEVTEAGRQGRGSLWQESLYGFRYILARPSLLGLQLVFFSINLTSTFAQSILAAMILARTSNDSTVLGSVMSSIALGGLAGGLILSVWGGPRRRVHGVLLGMTFSALLGRIGFGLSRSLSGWAVAGFLDMFFVPILNGSNQAIWQAKVAPDVQGRVFAARRLIAQITAPLAMLIAGPLADRFFEPGMMPGGSLAPAFGWLVGTGRGSGMAVMFLVSGFLGVAVGLGGYLFPAIRNAEDILPDHGAAHAPAAPVEEAAKPA